MKKSRKLLAILLAVTMCLSNIVFIATAEGESTENTFKVGDEFVLTTPGTDNKNGQFSFYVITRELPAGDLDTAEPWNSFDRAAAVSMADAVPMVVKDGNYYNASYVDAPSDSNEQRQDFIIVGDGKTLDTYQSPRDLKVISFTAPEAGEYDISFDIAGIYGLAVFTGYDDGELTLDTRFDDQATFKRTVTLAKGQTFNMGFTRVFGNYSANGANGILYPVHDDVACVVSNLKVVYACDGNNMVLGREFTLGTPGNSVSGDFKLGLAVRPENGAELQSVLNAPVSVENIIPMGYYENNTFTLSAYTIGDRRQNIQITNPNLFRVWSNCKYINVFQFEAPVDGVYELTFDIRSNYKGGVMTSVGNAPLTYKATYGDTSTNVYTETVALAKGETINFGFPRAYGNFASTDCPSWDTVDADITNLKVTYTGLDLYDFAAGFGSEDYMTAGNVFTVGTRPINTSTGTVGDFVVIGNYATQEDEIYCAAHNQKMTPGYYNSTYNNGSIDIAINSVFVPVSNPTKLEWYPSSSTETVVAFTAPVCGEYSFNFKGSMIWAASASMPSRYYVEANGEVVDGCDFTFVGTEVVDFKGTVTLGAGESIYFVYDPTKPEGGSYSSGGDNGRIDGLTVTKVSEGHSDELVWINSEDGNSHYQAHSCCKEPVTEAVAHVGGTSTCTTAKVCTVCGFSYGGVAGHLPSGEWICDNDTHSMKCANCDATFSPDASHVGNACGICGKYVYGIGNGDLVYNIADNFGSDNYSPWALYLTKWNPDTNNLGERFGATSYGFGTNDAFRGSKLINVSFAPCANRLGLFYESFNNIPSGSLLWTCLDGYDTQIVFTAPDSGDYEIDFSNFRLYTGTHATLALSPSRIYIIAGGEVVLDVVLDEASEVASLNKTVTLNAGDEIVFGHDPVDNQADAWGTDGADENVITKLTVTYVDGCSHPADKIEWNNTETTHYGYCTKCNTVIAQNGEHEGGSATCTKQAECTVCGQSYGDTLGHADVDGTWTAVDGGHVFNRTCCDETDVTTPVPHNGDPCTDCGYETPVAIPPYVVGIQTNSTDSRVGFTVVVKVKVDGSAASFASGQLVINYDEALLDFNSDLSDLLGYTFNAENGVLSIAGYGEAIPMGAEFELVFNAVVEGNAVISLEDAAFSTDDRAATEDLIDATIDEDADTVTIAIAPGEYDVTLPEILGADTTVAIGGESFTFYVTDGNYNYVIKVFEGETELALGVDFIDNGDGTFTILEVNDDIRVEATRTPKTFGVTVPEKHKGENAATATYGTDYTLTILPNVDADTEPGVIYTATVTIGGAPATFKSINGNVYVIAGADITGDIVITVTEQEVPVNKYTVTVEGDTDGVTVPSATVSQGQTATLNVAPVEGYVYNVTATVGGVAATVTVSGNVYTVANVRGNVVFTVTMTVPTANLTVGDAAYLNLNGTSLWLVINDADKLQSGVYTYGGQDMFWSEKYDAYCILVLGNKPTDFAELGINKNGTAAEVDYSGDVNKTGKIDANDAQLVYNMYNADTTYSDFTTVSMEKFLRADVNGDATVTTLDAVVIIGLAVNN